MQGLGRWGEGYGVDLDLHSRTVTGAVAGDLAVPGILTTDELQLVQPVNVASAELTDEFTISADGTINNAGGTSTATQVVLVVWQRAVVRDNPLGV